MSGTTTNHALRYPTSGDNVAPLETVFLNLATDVDNRIPKVYGADGTGGGLTLTAAEQDLPSATVTFTVAGTAAVAVITVTCDFEATVISGTTAALGLASVDGVTQTKQAIYRPVANNDRACITQMWKVSLAAGAHTIKLRGKKTGAGGTMTLSDLHSGIVVVVYDPGV